MDGSATWSPRIERRALLLVLGTFGFFGTAFGTWLVLLAELQAAFSLSPATLGTALATGLLVSLPVMQVKRPIKRVEALDEIGLILDATDNAAIELQRLGNDCECRVKPRSTQAQLKAAKGGESLYL